MSRSILRDCFGNRGTGDNMGAFMNHLGMGASRDRTRGLARLRFNGLRKYAKQAGGDLQPAQPGGNRIALLILTQCVILSCFRTGHSTMRESSKWEKIIFIEQELRKTQIEIVRLMQYEHVLTRIAASIQDGKGGLESDTGTALQDVVSS